MDFDRTTDDLQQELMVTEDLSKFIGAHAGELFRVNVAEAVNALYQEKKTQQGRKLSKTALAQNAGISQVHLHQIFAGSRNPTRNCLLNLCFGMSATLEETQALLKQCGHAQLYPRRKRDAIIIFVLAHGGSLQGVNELLVAEGQEPLT